ncbi:MAG TPA: hypothetical protein PKD59_14395 [Miltoncostaeaceae bacterium]|nr:hypothetical protein [Miltoncostaeaceae bacterium]
MSTRPLPPPDFLRDDPGPWSVVSSVFSQAGRPGRRRPQPPTGLMLSPPPAIGLTLAGIDPASPVAGVGQVTVVAAAREPALALEFEDGGALLRGVSAGVRRAWSVPDLTVVAEERPAEDPAASIPPQVHPASLTEADLPGAVADPTGTVVAAFTREGRFDVLAVLRDDRSVVRWVRGVRAAAWSPDGLRLALGGTWGVLLAQAREAVPGD